MNKRIQVPVVTLKSALRFLPGKDVYWLKIDVEGFEEKVLQRWDSHTFALWVIAVEAMSKHYRMPSCSDAVLDLNNNDKLSAGVSLAVIIVRNWRGDSECIRNRNR